MNDARLLPLPPSASALPRHTGRGAAWLAALAGGATLLPGYPPSVQVADAELAGRPARWIAVVPDPANPFPRARTGEVGLVEGWALARAVHEAIDADRELPASAKRAIVAVVDVSSQAYGRREEAFGIHEALAGAASAYAQARLDGHPVIGLLVGKAMSGAFLAHGYQANRLIALDDPGVMVHAMGKAAAARVTLRSIEDLERLAADVPPMAYDIASYATLGLLWRRVAVDDAERPSAAGAAAGARACSRRRSTTSPAIRRAASAGGSAARTGRRRRGCARSWRRSGEAARGAPAPGGDAFVGLNGGAAQRAGQRIRRMRCGWVACRQPARRRYGSRLAFERARAASDEAAAPALVMTPNSARHSVMAADLPPAGCLRPHDLLWLRSDAALDVAGGAPAWVTARLAAGTASFSPVVVRRAAVTSTGRIPVGLRGATRGERWAAQVAASDVVRSATPEDIAHARGWTRAGPLAAFAAVRLLAHVAPLLDASPLAWGVAGGVGHALATGRADGLRPDSDLDLLLRAPSPADAAALRDVAAKLAGLAAEARIDVQVETPLGAFALAEWSRGGGGGGGAAAVLLKTAAGPALVVDPWRVEAAGASSGRSCGVAVERHPTACGAARPAARTPPL